MINIAVINLKGGVGKSVTTCNLAAQLAADIAAWQTRFAGSVTLWVSYPDALCTAATDALGTTGVSLGMENLLVTSSTALDADSRAALEQAAADAGVQHVVVHDTAAFR